MVMTDDREPEVEEIIGFVVTPGEIGDRIAALNEAINGLATSVQTTPLNDDGFNAAWRAEFDAFLRRWAVERDSYASWDSRLFATRVMPRIEAFEASYNQWSRDFTRKTKKAPLVPRMRAQTSMLSGWFPLALGVATVAVVLSFRRK